MKSQNVPHPSPEQTTEQISVDVSKRQLMALAVSPLLLLVLARQSKAADVAACFDLDSLPASQRSTRRTLGFKLATSDTQNCGLCAFFTPSAGSCGNCAMLSGGVVSTAYVCESWAAKK